MGARGQHLECLIAGETQTFTGADHGGLAGVAAVCQFGNGLEDGVLRISGDVKSNALLGFGEAGDLSRDFSDQCGY